MFGWFSPKCPLDTWEKAWTEHRMQWLARQFGVDRMTNSKLLLPDADVFTSYRGDFEDARRLMDLLGDHMRVDVRKLGLEICDDVQLPGAAGHYDKGEQTVIRTAASQLDDPMRLTATLAHELAHELLLGNGLISANEEDHEWVTDLLPVFLGVGIFAANATVHETHDRVGNVSWWSVGKQGYLPARIFGYAFALFAFFRGDRDVSWASHLRLDAAVALRDGLRFLQKKGDSLFHPDTIHAPQRPSTAVDLASRLCKSSPSSRVATLWEIRTTKAHTPEVIRSVVACLRDADDALRWEAAKTLAAVGDASEEVIDGLRSALWADSANTQAWAAYALGELRPPLPEVARELCSLLRDRERQVIVTAAQALGKLGAELPSAAPLIVTALVEAANECDDNSCDGLAAALAQLTDDATPWILQQVPREDRELRQRLLEMVQAQRTNSANDRG